MIKIRSPSSSIFVNAAFSPPLFDWQGVPGRFFEMVHTALAPDITISPRDFSVVNGNSLADVMAKFNLFGGANRVILSADNLSVEFPNIFTEEYELALRIMDNVFGGFPKHFVGHSCNTMQITSFEHAEIVSRDDSAEYLERFCISRVKDVSESIEAIYAPAGRFSLSGKDARWRAVCSVEMSQRVANALFLHFDITLLGVSDEETFVAKLTRCKQISDACAAALGLEWQNAG